MVSIATMTEVVSMAWLPWLLFSLLLMVSIASMIEAVILHTSCSQLQRWNISPELYGVQLAILRFIQTVKNTKII